MDASLQASTSSSTKFSSSPRSPKKMRLDEDVEMLSTEQPSSSSQETICSVSEKIASRAKTLAPLPPAELLISLPSLLIHPPNHHFHARSLCMSLLAIRRCLRLPDLSPEIECRAWTTLAELGMTVIGGGFQLSEEHVWALGVEAEIEEATSKGLLIARKHPSLRSYCPQLTFLAAQLALWQQNVKFARTLLRRLLTTFTPNDPPHVVYSAHLQLISHLTTSTTSRTGSPSKSNSHSPFTKIPQDMRAAFNAVQDMQNLAQRNAHDQVVILTHVLRLRLLVSTGLWEQVEEALGKAEGELGIEFSSEKEKEDGERAGDLDVSRKGLRVSDINVDTANLNLNASPSKTPKKGSAPSQTNQTQTQTQTSPDTLTIPPPPSVMPKDAFTTSMTLHTLIIGVVFYTYVGRASDASARLARLHVLLDGGALKFDRKAGGCRGNTVVESSTTFESGTTANIIPPSKEKEDTSYHGTENESTRELNACGIVQVPLSSSSHSSSSFTPPLYIQTTHPRVLYVLAYLVSCIAKKDPVGRKPKRKVFAMEGLRVWEKEVRRELKVPAWGCVGDVELVEGRMGRVKGDLLCELVGVSIMRSEFKAAEETLNVLISHLRNSSLFSSFSARVTLHHAHLAHAKGDTERAMKCYEVARELAEEKGDEFVTICAKAGLVGLRIGLIRSRGKQGGGGRGGGTHMHTSTGQEAVADVDEMDVDGQLEEEGEKDKEEWEDIMRMGQEVAEECRGMGGTMWSVGHVIEACLTEEIIRAKQHLKTALSHTSTAGDNHLRALILALIASHYFHTSTRDALDMLGTCGNLAAGLGAGAGNGTTGVKKNAAGGGKNGDALGNAPLRVWVGERSLEIHKRNGDTTTAQKQEAANQTLRLAIEKAEKAQKAHERSLRSSS